MQPITVFEAHFRASDALLKVYRLLSADEGAAEHGVLLPKLRAAISCDADEELLLLLNDLFVGLVRQRANVAPAFFKRSHLALLLRQAVVSACTAMDVYFPALLEAHLPQVIQVRQRNFLPQDGEVKKLFENFRLKLEDLPALLEEENGAERWGILARRVLAFCREQTLSNVTGISATMLLLGVEQPWKKIAEGAGTNEGALRNQIQALTKRRNDIIHRGDRPVGQPEGEPQAIEYAWANANVYAIQSVVLSCDALARDTVGQLRATAAGA